MRLRQKQEKLAEIGEPFNNLLARSPAATYSCEPSGNYATTLVSENVKAQLGYESREFVDDPEFWASHIHPEDRETVFEGLSRLVESGHQVHEYRFLHKDGSYRWMRDGLNLMRDEQGNSLEIVGYWVDITAQKQAEEEVRRINAELEEKVDARTADTRASEEKFRDLTEASVQGVVVHNGKPLFANQAAADIFGYASPEQIMELDDINLIFAPHERFRSLERREARLRGEDVPQHFEFQGIRKDGQLIWVDAFVRVIRWEDKPAIQCAYIDITKWKQAQESMRESERRFKDFAEISSDWFWEMGPDLRFTWFSDRVEEATGAPVEFLIGKTRRELGASEEDSEKWERHFEDLEQRRPFRNFRYWREDPDGGMQHMTVSGIPVFNADGQFLGYRGTGADITEAKRAVDELRESKQLLQAVFDSIPHTMAIKNRDSRYLMINKAWTDIYGVLPEDVLNKHTLEVPGRPEEDKISALKEDQIVLSGDERSKTFDHTRTTKNGGRFHFQDIRVPLRDGNDEVVGLVAIALDITERKLAEKELLEANQRLKYHSQHTLQILEDERRRIAQELHDEIGQSLTALKLKLGNLNNKIESTELTSELEECTQITEIALNEVRNLSLDLRPTKLDDLGLTAALRWLLDRQTRLGGFRAQIQENLNFGFSLPKQLETTCFRVAQEALTNIVRHAHSDNVVLNLIRGTSELEISIQDDGKGFVVSDAFEKTQKGQCLGLLGMQERVELAGGRLEITSSPDRGTNVFAVFPLDQSNEEDL